MCQKKSGKNQLKLKETLKELDSAFNEWGNMSEKLKTAEESPRKKLHKRTKALLQKLEEQLQEFDAKP